MSRRSDVARALAKLPKRRRSRALAEAPPSSRLFRLQQQDMKERLGEARCRELCKVLERERTVLEQLCCSGAWFTATWDRGQEIPDGMVLSRAATQYTSVGESTETVPTRRLTPAIAVDLEDLIDLQSPGEAATYPHPPSVSAQIILQIQHMRARI